MAWHGVDGAARQGEAGMASFSPEMSFVPGPKARAPRAPAAKPKISAPPAAGFGPAGAPQAAMPQGLKALSAMLSGSGVPAATRAMRAKK